MLRVTRDYLVSSDVGKVIFQNLFAQHINQSLDVLSHFLFILCLFQLREVQLRKCRHEELDVKRVTIGVRFELEVT